MVIFLNYEGFELISNASREIRDPRKSLPVAFLGGGVVVMIVYALIAVVTVGHLSQGEVARYSTYSLSEAARLFDKCQQMLEMAVLALQTDSTGQKNFWSSQDNIVGYLGENEGVCNRDLGWPNINGDDGKPERTGQCGGPGLARSG